MGEEGHGEAPEKAHSSVLATCLAIITDITFSLKTGDNYVSQMYLTLSTCFFQIWPGI